MWTFFLRKPQAHGRVRGLAVRSQTLYQEAHIDGRASNDDMSTHAGRETRLKVQQFSKSDRSSSAGWGRIRYMTRKELLDEANALNSSAHDSTLSPSVRRPNANLLRARDVRKVDPNFSTRLEPAILVRTGCIILSLGRILCLITRESLYCILASGQEEIVRSIATNLMAMLVAGEAESDVAAARDASEFESAGGGGMPRSHSAGSLPTLPTRPGSLPTLMSPPLGARLDAKAAVANHLGVVGTLGGLAVGGPAHPLHPIRETPDGPTYEFCALEAVLMTASAELSRRQTSLSETLQKALTALRRNVVGTQVVAGARQLDHVRQLKQSVRELLVQSQAFEEALREVLEEDEDMAAMYLTRRAIAGAEAGMRLSNSGSPDVSGSGWPGGYDVSTQEHEEVELLLESYLQEVGATVAELEVLTYGIEGTEKFVSFRLDSARNRLLKFDVIATASATALGVGQLISGLFGMNLPTSLFDPEVAGEDTTFVVVTTATVSLVLVLIVFLLLVFYSPLVACLASVCYRDDGMSSLSATIDEHLGLARRPSVVTTTTTATASNGQPVANGVPASVGATALARVRSIVPPGAYVDIKSASTALVSNAPTPAPAPAVPVAPSRALRRQNTG